MLHSAGLVGRLLGPGSEYATPVGAPTVSFDLTVGPLPAGWTFTRASTATDCLWTDGMPLQAYTTYATDQVRFLPRGLLIEPSRTNYFINSDAPVTQTITLAGSGGYCLWMLGTGSVALSPGTAVISAGATGTATHGVKHTFTVATGGTVTVTCTGSPSRVQLQNHSIPTSYIPTTGAAVTRAEERLTFPLSTYTGIRTGTYWVEFCVPDALPGLTGTELLTTSLFGTGTTSSHLDLFVAGDKYQASSWIVETPPDHLIQANQVSSRVIGSVSRAAYTTGVSNWVAIDGLVTSTPNPDNKLGSTAVGTVGCGTDNMGAINGYIRGFKYWLESLTEQQLSAVTMPGYARSKPIIDWDFRTGVLPKALTYARLGGTGDAVATDSRYTDAAGSSFNSFGPHTAPVPRFVGANGIILEASRPNFFINPATPITKIVGSFGLSSTYLVWFIGTGNVTITDATGRLGVVNGPNPVVAGTVTRFNMSVAGNLNFTIAGTINRIQVEGISGNAWAASPTTFINSTNTSVNRGGDILTLPNNGWFSTEERTMYMEVAMMGYGLMYSFPVGLADIGNPEHREVISFYNEDPAIARAVLYGATRSSVPGEDRGHPQVGDEEVTPNVFYRVAYSFSKKRGAVIAKDGKVGDRDVIVTSEMAPPAYLTLGAMYNTAANSSLCQIRTFKMWDYAFSDAELVYATSGPTLDLSFMSPGVLDTRMVFTRASVASYYDSTGRIQSAATNAPRWDYDPSTLQLRGLLIEEARTNQTLWSGDLTNAAWPKTSFTLSAGVLGPNGPVTGSGIVGNNGAIAFVSQNINVTAGNTYTVSGFFKAGSLPSVVILLSATAWSDATNRVASFNLLTGVVSTTTGAGATASITPAGNGWYRCSITATPSVSVAMNTQFGRSGSNGDGVSTQFYMFGAQMEAGGFATSYIPTTTMAVTRAADVISMPIAGWYQAGNPTSVVAECTFRGSGAVTGDRSVWRMDDGTSNNRFVVYTPSTTTAIQGFTVVATVAGGTVNAISSGLPYGTPVRLGGVFQAANNQQCVNGGIVNSVNHVLGIPGGITTLRIGNVSAAGGANLTGWMRSLRYWPRALTDAELQAATAP